ncbi:SIMPL domain-containing protein [Clostridium celatum]|uniref:SIMPL domain-containing protein n=1 Tax=Clostridium celatum TaxID=36834 RepID=UPI0028FDC4C3|nr:SIMPL domain-containing protein [Clostridium celatum]MDU2265799.1 SIMPL domain-containing protein [Clostridium celatum]MDU3724281.1 SIMPL domain-containing protein [Clostridium celatum]MDU6296020.1 SIMPL domain-containing protein [Clostridium celatum]
MERLITVKGIGNINIKPDLIIINMELVSHKYDYEETMKLATDSVSKLEKAIEEAGFNKKELKTTSFNIRTSYKSYYDENKNYKNKFDGYICEQGLKLQFDLDMQVLSKVLTAITKSGVEPRLNIRFSVKDKEKVNEELLINATENARRKAEVLAKASKVNLGKLLTINYNWSEVGIYSKTTYEMENKSLVMEEAYAPNIEPDDIELSDTATFVWEIK